MTEALREAMERILSIAETGVFKNSHDIAEIARAALEAKGAPQVAPEPPATRETIAYEHDFGTGTKLSYDARLTGPKDAYETRELVYKTEADLGTQAAIGAEPPAPRFDPRFAGTHDSPLLDPTARSGQSPEAAIQDRAERCVAAWKDYQRRGRAAGIEVSTQDFCAGWDAAMKERPCTK